MNARLLLLAALAAPLPAATAPSPELQHLQRTQRAAADLFRSGATEQAVSHLRQNLPPEPGPGGAHTALPQALIALAADFYNRRELRLARLATLQARALAASVLDGTAGATPQRRAQLYSSLGLLHETVLFEANAALACYEAALALQPGDPLSRTRRLGLIELQRRRPGGAR